jgi:hypothetical protein
MAASYCNALAWETAHGLVLRWMAVMDLQHHCLAVISDGIQRDRDVDRVPAVKRYPDA